MHWNWLTYILHVHVDIYFHLVYAIGWKLLTSLLSYTVLSVQFFLFIPPLGKLAFGIIQGVATIQWNMFADGDDEG